MNAVSTNINMDMGMHNSQLIRFKCFTYQLLVRETEVLQACSDI